MPDFLTKLFLLKLFIHVFLLVAIVDCNTTIYNQEIEQVEYSASSRGSILDVVISKNYIKCNEDRTEITTAQWKALTILVQEINLKSINSLEAPTNDRFRDAAMAAELKIVYDTNIYVSSQFDHGNPPKELSNLVKEILSLAKIIDKE
jgi:hypothetical protein